MQIARRKLALIGLFVITAGSAGMPAVHSQSNTPQISLAYVRGKKLFVQGSGFEMDAVVSINGTPEKTHNKGEEPDKLLVVKKGGKMIQGHQSVLLTVKNPDGTVSAPYSMNPMETVLTLADDGGTINLKVGDGLFVYLGTSYHWMLQPYDTSILVNAAGGAGTLIVGAQALLKAINTGQTTLSLVGDPPCRDATPPCEAPSRLFTVTIVVTE